MGKKNPYININSEENIKSTNLINIILKFFIISAFYSAVG